MSDQMDRLKRRLAAIPEAAKKAALPGLIKSAVELADRMKALAPEKSGALRESIVVTLPGGSTPAYGTGGARLVSENEVIVTAGNAEVRYAAHVEFGTKHAAAEPYFWPAYRLTKKRARNRIKRAISSAVKSTWGAS